MDVAFRESDSTNNCSSGAMFTVAGDADGNGGNGEAGPKIAFTMNYPNGNTTNSEIYVMDADGTLILHLGPLSGGTELTRRLCVKHHRPHWLVDLDASPDAASVLYWLDEQQIEVLNVAGPRGSALAGLNVIARDFLLQVFHDMS